MQQYLIINQPFWKASRKIFYFSKDLIFKINCLRETANKRFKSALFQLILINNNVHLSKSLITNTEMYVIRPDNKKRKIIEEIYII
jgi:hypothetical protein